jgi:hypothetical protein
MNKMPASKSNSVSPKTLLGWNLFMGIVQLGMGIFLTVLFNKEKLFKRESTYYVGVDPDFNGDMVKTKYALKTGDDDINVAAETVAFFYTTSFFHFLYAIMSKGPYQNMVYQQNNNYLRWLEYSITATLMIRIIAIQAGIREDSTLQAITVGTIGVMLQGQIVEGVLATKSKLTESDKRILFVATIVGWLIMFWIFIIIIQQFLRLQKNVDEFGCDDVKIPEWVVAIIITQCIFYASFGFIQLFQIWKRLYRNESYDYSQFELFYLIDSLASKVTLGGILAYGLVGADKGINSEIKCITPSPSPSPSPMPSPNN